MAGGTGDRSQAQSPLLRSFSQSTSRCQVVDLVPSSCFYFLCVFCFVLSDLSCLCLIAVALFFCPSVTNIISFCFTFTLCFVWFLSDSLSILYPLFLLQFHLFCSVLFFLYCCAAIFRPRIQELSGRTKLRSNTF